MPLAQIGTVEPIGNQRLGSRYYFEKWTPHKYGGTWQQRFDWAQANISRDPQQMEALRRQLLGDLLRHAASEVPYYRQLFNQLGAKPDELLEPQCFTRLPLLTRTHLRQQLEQLVAEDAGRYRLEHSSTSGSTGTPTQYYHGAEYARQSAVNIVRNQLWTGWRYGEPVVKIWGWVSAFGLTLQDRFAHPGGRHAAQ